MKTYKKPSAITPDSVVSFLPAIAAVAAAVGPVVAAVQALKGRTIDEPTLLALNSVKTKSE